MCRKTFSLFSKFRNFPIHFAVLGLILLMSIARLWVYGDLRLSIASHDTRSYVDASHVPLFSSDMMSGLRLLSTNLLYKVLEPKNGYEILVNGSMDTTRRLIQPGFDRIVILQTMISIAGWGLLAFFAAEQLKKPVLKIMSAALILLFAYTPQMADWDSILMSESLTFSLFALQLAFLIKIAFSFHNNPKSVSPFLIFAWAFTFFWWTFLRDTNLYASLSIIGMTVAIFVSSKYRSEKFLYIILVFVIGILVIGLYTSANSTRLLVPIAHIYNDDLLSSPARVATLTELGMPQPGSAEYQAWFQENSKSALIKFMLIHPGYPTLKILNVFPFIFTEIKQTYFRAPNLRPSRDVLMSIGDALHPENTTPFLLSTFLIFGLFLLGKENVTETSRPWAWISIWLFLTASITLIPSILGDTMAINRHALLSTMIYRLMPWLLSILIIDIALAPPDTKSTAIRAV